MSDVLLASPLFARGGGGDGAGDDAMSITNEANGVGSMAFLVASMRAGK